MDDAELLQRFESGTLDEFPHESHLRMVYLLAAGLTQASGFGRP